LLGNEYNGIQKILSLNSAFSNTCPFPYAYKRYLLIFAGVHDLSEHLGDSMFLMLGCNGLAGWQNRHIVFPTGCRSNLLNTIVCRRE